MSNNLSAEEYPTYRLKAVEDLDDIVIRVPLPRRSLLVMTGEPRYQWEHAILRKDIETRRIVIAYRELVKHLNSKGWVVILIVNVDFYQAAIF
jgi:hypothetical protein